MEFFQRAKMVRLRSHRDKYLLADDDEESVYQDRHGCYHNAKWSVEIVPYTNMIRLKSCYGKYLTATNMPFLLGATGKKVLQTFPSRLDSSLEWEPIREGVQVRLKTHYGHYLRANGGPPPWRNSITHDIPYRTKKSNWILWDVDLVEIRPQDPGETRQRPTPIVVPNNSRNIISLSPSPSSSPSPYPSPSRSPSPYQSPPYSPSRSPSPNHYSAKIYLKSPRPIECRDLEEIESPVKEGRTIFYNVGDENGDVPDGRRNGEKFFTFKGSSVEELKLKLKEETGIDDIVVCCRNPLNARLYPLRLQLPPNNSDMHVVVVPSSLEE